MLKNSEIQNPQSNEMAETNCLIHSSIAFSESNDIHMIYFWKGELEFALWIYNGFE